MEDALRWSLIAIPLRVVSAASADTGAPVIETKRPAPTGPIEQSHTSSSSQERQEIQEGKGDVKMLPSAPVADRPDAKSFSVGRKGSTTAKLVSSHYRLLKAAATAPEYPEDRIKDFLRKFFQKSADVNAELDGFMGLLTVTPYPTEYIMRHRVGGTYHRFHNYTYIRILQWFAVPRLAEGNDLVRLLEDIYGEIHDVFDFNVTKVRFAVTAAMTPPILVSEREGAASTGPFHGMAELNEFLGKDSIDDLNAAEERAFTDFKIAKDDAENTLATLDARHKTLSDIGDGGVTSTWDIAYALHKTTLSPSSAGISYGVFKSIATSRQLDTVIYSDNGGWRQISIYGGEDFIMPPVEPSAMRAKGRMTMRYHLSEPVIIRISLNAPYTTTFKSTIKDAAAVMTLLRNAGWNPKEPTISEIRGTLHMSGIKSSLHRHIAEMFWLLDDTARTYVLPRDHNGCMIFRPVMSLNVNPHMLSYTTPQNGIENVIETNWNHVPGRLEFTVRGIDNAEAFDQVGSLMAILMNLYAQKTQEYYNAIGRFLVKDSARDSWHALNEAMPEVFSENYLKAIVSVSRAPRIVDIGELYRKAPAYNTDASDPRIIRVTSEYSLIPAPVIDITRAFPQTNPGRISAIDTIAYTRDSMPVTMLIYGSKYVLVAPTSTKNTYIGLKQNKNFPEMLPFIPAYFAAPQIVTTRGSKVRELYRLSARRMTYRNNSSSDHQPIHFSTLGAIPDVLERYFNGWLNDEKFVFPRVNNLRQVIAVQPNRVNRLGIAPFHKEIYAARLPRSFLDAMAIYSSWDTFYKKVVNRGVDKNSLSDNVSGLHRHVSEMIAKLVNLIVLDGPGRIHPEILADRYPGLYPETLRQRLRDPTYPIDHSYARIFEEFFKVNILTIGFNGVTRVYFDELPTKNIDPNRGLLLLYRRQDGAYEPLVFQTQLNNPPRGEDVRQEHFLLSSYASRRITSVFEELSQVYRVSYSAMSRSQDRRAVAILEERFSPRRFVQGLPVGAGWTGQIINAEGKMVGVNMSAPSVRGRPLYSFTVYVPPQSPLNLPRAFEENLVALSYLDLTLMVGITTRGIWFRDDEKSIMKSYYIPVRPEDHAAVLEFRTKGMTIWSDPDYTMWPRTKMGIASESQLILSYASSFKELTGWLYTLYVAAGVQRDEHAAPGDFKYNSLGEEIKATGRARPMGRVKDFVRDHVAVITTTASDIQHYNWTGIDRDLPQKTGGTDLKAALSELERTAPTIVRGGRLQLTQDLANVLERWLNANYRRNLAIAALSQITRIIALLTADRGVVSLQGRDQYQTWVQQKTTGLYKTFYNPPIVSGQFPMESTLTCVLDYSVGDPVTDTIRTGRSEATQKTSLLDYTVSQVQQAETDITAGAAQNDYRFPVGLSLSGSDTKGDTAGASRGDTKSVVAWSDPGSASETSRSLYTAAARGGIYVVNYFAKDIPTAIRMMADFYGQPDSALLYIIYCSTTGGELAIQFNNTRGDSRHVKFYVEQETGYVSTMTRMTPATRSQS